MSKLSSSRLKFRRRVILLVPSLMVYWISSLPRCIEGKFNIMQSTALFFPEFFDELLHGCFGFLNDCLYEPGEHTSASVFFLVLDLFFLYETSS